MTKDEIIRMAREANDYANKVCRQDTIPREWRLVRDVRFAALVAAHEREKQAEQEPIGMIIGGRLESLVDEYETGAWPIYAAPVQQAEQEPIGNISLWHNHGHQNHNVEYCGTLPDGLHQLYTHSVRTKDLTEAEIDEIWKKHSGGNLGFAYAVIAADREKNK